MKEEVDEGNDNVAGLVRFDRSLREKKDSTAVITNEKAVDDGAPCAYACGFSERRAARASACVIGSR